MDIMMKAAAMPPMELLEKEAISRPPAQFRASARPPDEFVRSSAISHPPSELEGHSGAAELLRPTRYFVVWYDQTYPYGEFTGYQDYLSTVLAGVPIKIENDYQKALRQLNKASANTQYILVATGRKKKQLVKEVHDNASVERIYVIKPFVEKVMKWGRSLKKFKAFSDFKQLIEELKQVVRPHEKSGYHYDVVEKMINYTVEPNPMTMCEQSVRALQDELEQEDDQIRFKHQYSIVLSTLKKDAAERFAKYNKTGDTKLLANPLGRDTTELLKAFTTWQHLLSLAIYFDECPSIVSGASLEVLAASSISVGDALFESINKLGECLEKEKGIDRVMYTEELSQFHQALFKMLVEYISEREEAPGAASLYLTRMLLLDIDMCVKYMLHCLLKEASDFEDLDYEVLHAAVVSDTRVSVLIDLCSAWKNQPIPDDIALPEPELKKAVTAMSVKNVVILNTSGLLAGLRSRLPAGHTSYEYSISRDFVVDWDTQAKLHYSFCYFVMEPSLTVSEYNVILDTCIRNAITPIFVLYVPEYEAHRLAKSMFKARWTVTLVYCTAFDQILAYLAELENNINRDLMQYSKYYDNFKAVLDRAQVSKESELTADSKEEADAGWEVLTSVNNEIFSHLVEELSLGVKLVGSLHYYVFSEMRKQKRQKAYWENYAPLFGISEKFSSILDVNCAKCLLRAYTLQISPPFYKMLNDAFRGGNPESMAKYRAFFSMLHDLVKKSIMKKYIGFVYRGTYFNPALISTLKQGTKVFSTCFTSTSKSESVARDFARKTKRNVLLEIELDPHANSNVDIHGEQCSRYPEEQEVLLLPFASFEIQRVFREESGMTILSLKEVIPDQEVINLKGIEYYT